MTCSQCGHSWNEPVAACPLCTELLERRAALAPNFRDLSGRIRTIPPPADLNAALAEFDAVRQVRRARTSRRWIATVGGALAASLLAGSLLVRQQPQPRSAIVTPQPSAEAVSFLPIPYTQPIQPYERVMVVQTFVPVRALIAAGFEVRVSDPGASVQADVMVSQDGRPRAIRPVSFNMSDRRLP